MPKYALKNLLSHMIEIQQSLKDFITKLFSFL